MDPEANRLAAGAPHKDLHSRIPKAHKDGLFLGSVGVLPSAGVPRKMEGQTTPTTYESVGGGENRTRTDLRSREDQGAIQIEKVQDKVDDAAGRGVDHSTFGANKEGRDDKADAGATGTGTGA